MNVNATEEPVNETNAPTPTSGECGASVKPVSWSAQPRVSSRTRGVLITVGILAFWLVLFLVLASPILIDLWTSRPPASTCDSPSSLSSSSQSPSEIK